MTTPDKALDEKAKEIVELKIKPAFDGKEIVEVSISSVKDDLHQVETLTRCGQRNIFNFKTSNFAMAAAKHILATSSWQWKT